MENNQIKTRQRVADHGEVYTAEKEVKAMCDLVKEETERIESRFLEPACGNGNFLAEILTRKLEIVTNRYIKSPLEFEKYSVIAISSMYGVDILEDNILECRQRLFNIWDNIYTKNTKEYANEECRKAVKYILSKNILCGDALTLLQNNGLPIIFAEWTFIKDNLVKRKDYALNELLEGGGQLTIENITWEYDEEIKAFIPPAINEYPLTDYRKVYEHE